MSDEFRPLYWDGDTRTPLTDNQTDIEMEAENYELHASSWVHFADGVECGYVRIYRRKPESLLEAIKVYLAGGALDPLLEAIAREEAKDA